MQHTLNKPTRTMIARWLLIACAVTVVASQYTWGNPFRCCLYMLLVFRFYFLTYFVFIKLQLHQLDSIRIVSCDWQKKKICWCFFSLEPEDAAVPVHAKCQPTYEVVELRPSYASEHADYFPPSTLVKRCTGVCASDLKCQPGQKTSLKYSVYSLYSL